MEKQVIVKFLQNIKDAVNILDINDGIFYPVDVVLYNEDVLPHEDDTAVSYDNGNYVITFGDLVDANSVLDGANLIVRGTDRYSFYKQKLIAELCAETHMVNLVYSESVSAFKLHTAFMDAVKSSCSTLRSGVTMEWIVEQIQEYYQEYPKHQGEDWVDYFSTAFEYGEFDKLFEKETKD